jgi:hypothetical protein
MEIGDKDIRWIMKANLGKNRLKKMDPDWVDEWTKYPWLNKR